MVARRKKTRGETPRGPRPQIVEGWSLQFGSCAETPFTIGFGEWFGGGGLGSDETRAEHPRQITGLLEG